MDFHGSGQKKREKVDGCLSNCKIIFEEHVDMCGCGWSRGRPGVFETNDKGSQSFSPLFFHLLIKFDKTGWTLNGI